MTLVARRTTALERARVDLDLTYEQLAEKSVRLGIPLSRMTLYTLCHGTSAHQPMRRTRRKAARLLDSLRAEIAKREPVK